VVLADRVVGGGEDRVQALHHLVRREPTVRPAAVHRSPAGVEPQPDAARGLDLGGQHVAAVAREDVVVVGGRGAAGLGQPAEAGRRRGVHRLGVDPGPDRVQLDQPLEQRRVLRQPAGHPLVQVVVGVDQARREQAAGAVHVVVRQAARGRPSADRGDVLAVHDHMPGGVLGASRVDGRDGRAVDDHAGRREDARWTASRIFS
jgi:hypothetical protein